MTYQIKCVLVGDGAIGKTSMLITYTQGIYPVEYIPTVFDNYSLNLVVDGNAMQLGLWDTAGQEDYDRLRPLSYPGTDIFLVCFDVNCPISFANAKNKWIREVNHNCPKAPIVLVGTKIDLRGEPVRGVAKARNSSHCVSRSEGKNLAKETGAVRYLECSAKTQVGLEEVFEESVRVVLSGQKEPKKRERRKCVLV